MFRENFPPPEVYDLVAAVVVHCGPIKGANEHRISNALNRAVSPTPRTSAKYGCTDTDALSTAEYLTIIWSTASSTAEYSATRCSSYGRVYRSGSHNGSRPRLFIDMPLKVAAIRFGVRKLLRAGAAIPPVRYLMKRQRKPPRSL
jgi:hypothetical protein